MANERKYYLFCEDNCKFEGMTKEQILAAIAEATGNTVNDVDGAFITMVKELNKGEPIMLWFGSTAEFNAIPEKIENCLYITDDDTTFEDIDRQLQLLELGFDSLAQRISVLEAEHKKNGVVLLDLGDNDLTGQTIKNISKYTFVCVDVDALYKVPCFVSVAADGTFTINGFVSNNRTGGAGTELYINLAVTITGNLTENNGIVTKWDFSKYAINNNTSGETVIGGNSAAGCKNTKIIGIM